MHDIVIRGGTVIDGSGKPAFTGDVAIAGGRIVGGRRQAGTGAARHRRRWAAGHARLGRRAHALRRAGDVGSAARALVLARRHHGDVRQLRRRLRAGEEGTSRRADGPDGGRRGNSQSGARRRAELGVGDLPAIHGRARSPRARDRHRRAARASAAARLRDGRPRDPARASDRGRHRRDAPPHRRGAAMRRVRLHHLAHRLAQDAGRRSRALARRRRSRTARHRRRR